MYRLANARTALSQWDKPGAVLIRGATAATFYGITSAAVSSFWAAP
jgi:hypothetical protein